MKLLTDYFQSLELVKAGVPRDTADYFFQKDCKYNNTKKRYEPAFPYVPCWSIGALWEFLHGQAPDRVFSFDTEMSSSGLVEALVTATCNMMKDADLSKDKAEIRQ